MSLKEGTAEPLKIFISYSRADMEIADLLVVALEAAGFIVFIDRRDLPYGERWQQVISEHIRDSDTVVYLVSERSVSSRWVRWELQQVTELKKRLLPIVIAPCPVESLPPAIASIELLPKQGIFASETHFPDLVRALNTNRAWVMQSTKLASRTVDWIHGGRKTALLLRGAALQSAEAWRDRKPAVEAVSSDVLDFLLSSRQQNNRRQRAWVAGSLAVAIGAIALSVIAYTQSLEAKRQGQEALRQKNEAERQSNAAIAQSAALTSLASENDPARGLLLAHEALLRSDGKPTVTTLAALRNAVIRFGPTPLLEAGRRGLSVYDVTDAYALFRPVRTADIGLSENGRWLLVAPGTQEFWRLDLEDKNPANTMRVVDSGLIGSSITLSLEPGAISNSGRWIAIAPERIRRSGPGVYVFELGDDNTYRLHIAKLSGARPDYTECVFSNDSRYLAYGNHFWRLDPHADQFEPMLLPVAPGREPPSFSRDSKRIGMVAAEGDDITVRSWALPAVAQERQERFKSLAAASIAYANPFPSTSANDRNYEGISPDGRWDFGWQPTADRNDVLPVVRQFDDAGKLRASWTVPVIGKTRHDPAQNSDDPSIEQVAFSADGRRLVMIGNSLVVWDLTAKQPFARPLVDLATPGSQVAIDDAGRWVASFGQQLQIWDLNLPVPAAFPIHAKSRLEGNSVGSIREDHLKLRFSSKGQWLVLASRVVNSEFTEFWDLRFDDRSGDSNLARRNLSVPEWRSFFGNLDWHKTFPDQPLSAEPILAADALARAGRRGDAIAAYRKIAASEPDIKLDPEKRADLLGAQFYWEKGQDEAEKGRYDPALTLLRRAKQMNPAIPWKAEAMAGQLWAQQWETITKQLSIHYNASNGAMRDYESEPKVDSAVLLGDLKKILLRYPILQFDARPYGDQFRPGIDLYEFGQRRLAARVRDMAAYGLFDEALRSRATLAQTRAPDVPPEDELHRLAAEGLSARFKQVLESDYAKPAAGFADRAAPFDQSLAARMHFAFDLFEAFDRLRNTNKERAAKAAAQASEFRSLLQKLLAPQDGASILALFPPRVLNSICWEGATLYGFAAGVLPVCEAAVAGRDIPEFRDSRGVAYAAVGRFAEAIADFQLYLSKGSASTDRRAARTSWINTLNECTSRPQDCRNPFADPEFVRSIR